MGQAQLIVTKTITNIGKTNQFLQGNDAKIGLAKIKVDAIFRMLTKRIDKMALVRRSWNRCILSRYLISPSNSRQYEKLSLIVSSITLPDALRALTHW